MTFAAWEVAAIAGGVAIPLLLLLYFLKLRRREVEVSTTLLWRQAIRDLQANAPFQRLRKNILLFLQLLALIAALLALAQPEWRSGSSPGGRVVIVLDRSASMNAKDGATGKTRLEQAKAEAKDLVRSLRDATLLDRLFGAGAGKGGAGAESNGGDEALIIAFDASAEVRQPFTSSKPLLLAAIDAIEPTDARTSMVEAARLAGAHAAPALVEGKGLVSAPGAPIHVWSDGRIGDLSEVRVNAETQVVYHSVGEAATPNVGIVAMRATRAYDEPSKASIFIGVQSTDPKARSVDVELAIDGLVSGVREVKLAGAEPAQGGVEGLAATSGVVFNLDRAAGAALSARLVTNDALETDDRAWVVLPPAMRSAVALVTRGSVYLQSALEGLNLSSLTLLSPERFTAAAKKDGAEGLGAYDAVVFDGWAPKAEDMRSAGARGRWLVLGAVPAMEGLSAGEASKDPAIVIDWDRAHPALKHAALDALFIARPRTVKAGEGVRVLARTDGGPVLVEAVRGGVRAIVAAFDPADSTWPLDPGFVLFLAESLTYLTHEGGESGESARAGDVLAARLPIGASGVRARTADGREEAITPGDDGAVVYGPVRREGMYALRWDGPGGVGDTEVGGKRERSIAVNLLSPDESVIGARQTLPMATREVKATTGGGGPTRRPLWPIAAALALGLLMLEWWVYNRRVRL